MDWVFSLGYFAVKEHETSGLFSSVAKSCSKSKRGQYESTAPFRFLREPRLCAKPYPAEPRWEVGGLPRVLFILVRISARCYRAGRFWILFF